MRRAVLLTATIAALAFGWAAPAWAFDTGHHVDLSEAALTEAGFDADARSATVVSNWLTDYMNTPVYPDRALARRFDAFHFDNLTSRTAIDTRWAQLETGTRRVVSDAARRGDVEACLAGLGVSLHAVQDFYSHSNWVDAHPREPGGAFRTETYFHAPDATLALYTSVSPEAVFGELQPHGDYFSGMNKDSYVRPGWAEAYVFAYAATREWVAATRQWTAAVDPAFWARVQGYTPSPSASLALARTRTAARQLSAWGSIGYAGRLSAVRALVPTGTDGHWKGNGSGSFLGTVMSAYAHNPGRSPLAAKVLEILPDLTREMNAGEHPAALRGAVPALPLACRAVVVRTVSATELADSGLGGLDLVGSADLYARVHIGGQRFTETPQLDRSVVRPAWTAIAFVPLSTRRVPIHYALWDQDWPDPDDHCDITGHGKGTLGFAWDAALDALVGLPAGATAHALPQGGWQVESAGRDAGVSLRVTSYDLADAEPHPTLTGRK